MYQIQKHTKRIIVNLQHLASHGDLGWLAGNEQRTLGVVPMLAKSVSYIVQWFMRFFRYDLLHFAFISIGTISSPVH